MENFGAFFPKLGHFAGFSLHISLVGSAQLHGRGHYIFKLAGPVGDYTGARIVIIRRFFSIIRQKKQRRCDGWVGGGGGGDIVFLRVPNSLEGCDGWGKGRWYSGKIRPWQPRSSFG